MTPNRITNSMPPCNRVVLDSTKTNKGFQHLTNSSSKFLFSHHQSILASVENSEDHCGSRGMTSFMSQSGINQLNNFIFILAIMQIVYSVATMALGRAKMKRWKTWEKQTQTIYMTANGMHLQLVGYIDTKQFKSVPILSMIMVQFFLISFYK